MERNMKKWAAELIAAPVKKPFPILSFPSTQLLGISVRELISNSDAQARGMKLIADRVDAAASVSLMDLSVEAEAFGSTIRVSDNEVPTVTGAIVTDAEEAEALEIPPVGPARTGLYVESIRKAAQLITDRPVFAGTIGPYSLAGRLLDVSEIMLLCFDDPDMVHTVLRKTTVFLINYINAYKAAGANGVIVAEPLVGLLSPALAEEFCAPYMKQIVDAVQDEAFLVIYHNCGNNVLRMADSIIRCGAAGYHFGNAIDLPRMSEKIPDDVVFMGNIDPVGIFCGDADAAYEATMDLLKKIGHRANFVPSSGCDVPAHANLAAADAFYKAVEDYYRG